MKLVIAIINSKIEDEITSALSEADFRMTKLASSGGFLKKGSSTFLIAAEDDKIDDILLIIKSVTKQEESESNDKNYSVVFVTTMDQFLRY